jgi:tetratricopeptide (TPR) repeat protein
MKNVLTALAIGMVSVACASGGGGIRVGGPPAGSGASAPPAGATVQALYEAGRDDEVISRAAGTGVQPEEVWFGAQSLLRMGLRGEATEQFRRLRDTAASAPFRRAAEIALARLSGQPDALQVAQAGAAEFPNDPYVQFEVGVTSALQGDQTAAAQAFDAALNADPSFAYAYYYAGLAYERLNRPDLTVTRFESFIRLAPSAPERPQVESVLRTARGR